VLGPRTGAPAPLPDLMAAVSVHPAPPRAGARQVVADWLPDGPPSIEVGPCLAVGCTRGQHEEPSEVPTHDVAARNRFTSWFGIVFRTNLLPRAPYRAQPEVRRARRRLSTSRPEAEGKRRTAHDSLRADDVDAPGPGVSAHRCGAGDQTGC